jgi:spermidine synthase
MFLFFVPSVLLGMVSPFAVRLQARSVATMGNVAGRLYSLSTLGSIVGTVLATFWMIPSFGTSNLTRSIGLTLLVVSLFAILPRLRGQLAAGRLGGTAGSTAAVLLAVGLSLVPAPTFIPLHRGDFLIAEADSAYQHIGIVLLAPIPGTTQRDWALRMMFDKYIESEVVVEPCAPDAPGSMPVRVLQRGTERPSWESEDSPVAPLPDPPAYIRIKEPYTSGAKYTDMLHLPLVFNSSPRSCLIVGGGGGVVPTIFRHDYPDLTIDVAEIDPVVVRLAEQYFGFKANADRTTTTIVDGRVFIRDTPKQYDLVILDAFTGGRPPFHLMTREFLELVKARLTPKGVVHLNIISALEGPKGRFYRTVLRTFNDVFGTDHVYVFPKRYDPDHASTWADTDGTNVELIATHFDTVPNPLPYDEVVRRAEQLVQSRHVKIDDLRIHATHHRPEQRARDLAAEPVLTDDFAPVDMMVID